MSSGPSSSQVASAAVPPIVPPPSVPPRGRTPALTQAEREEAQKVVWRAPAELAEAPGSEQVLPQLEAPGIRIECVARRPIESLAERVEVCRERQRKQSRMLASTFCHGGSLFLVFKHWPYSAHPFPRSI